MPLFKTKEREREILYMKYDVLATTKERENGGDVDREKGA